MKYRDLITIFLIILFFLTLAYAIGVDMDMWYLPIISFVLLVFFVYKLWIEK